MSCMRRRGPILWCADVWRQLGYGCASTDRSAQWCRCGGWLSWVTRRNLQQAQAAKANPPNRLGRLALPYAQNPPPPLSQLAQPTQTYGSSATYQPTLPYPGQITTLNNESVIDRVAYFTTQPPGITSMQLDVEAYRQFYAMPSAIQSGGAYGSQILAVPPNHYGPSDLGTTSRTPTCHRVLPTAIMSGSGQSGGPGDPGTTYPTTPNDNYPVRIVLDPTQNPSVNVVNAHLPSGVNNPYASPGTSMKPVVPIPMAPLAFSGTTPLTLTPSSNYSTAMRLLRFSISEPAAGYAVPAAASILGSAKPWDDNWYFNSTSVQTTPFDSVAANNFKTTNDPNDALRQAAIITPAGADSTHFGYSIVYLQRLANPLQAWDPNANPYIIVDHMQVDLTTYNSEKGWLLQMHTPTQVEFQGIGGAFAFDTRQRSQVPAAGFVSPPPGTPQTGSVGLSQYL